MKFPPRIDGVEGAGLPPRPLHLAIGMFDGVHLGHQAVIEAAVQSARAEGGLSAVLSFSPHPSVILRPAHPTLLIQDDATKSAILLQLGIDVVITQPFTAELARMNPREFLPWLKRQLPHLTAIYVGENFQFGQGRGGDVSLLISVGRRHDIRIFSSPRVNLDGEPISSTRIRALLVAGDVAAANACLGHHYRSAGAVIAGKQLGRTLGFPTLNLGWAPQLRPRYGVYAVRISGGRVSKGRPAVANYGVRPTVENQTEPRLEVHVLGACPWGDGDTVDVEWLAFLRPEKKFADIGQLQAQIARDKLAAQRYFGQ